jgi:hypothetical protein
MLAQQPAVLRKLEKMPVAETACSGHERERRTERDSRTVTEEVFTEEKAPVPRERDMSE